MPKLKYSDIKRFDLVLIEANIFRRRKGFRNGLEKPVEGKARNFYAAPWEETTWEANLQLVDLSLLVSAPVEYDDENFGVVGGVSDSQMSKRAFEF